MKLVVAAAGVALLAACATGEKPSGGSEDVVEKRVIVKAVDLPERLVVIATDEGEEFSVRVDEAAPNLEQVQVGDSVLVSYTRALAWQVKPSSKGAPGESFSANVSSARPGERPRGSVEGSVTVTSTITAVDMEHGMVTLTGPDGGWQTFKVDKPGDLRKVRVGDLVDITYREALAISVRPDVKR